MSGHVIIYALAAVYYLSLSFIPGLTCLVALQSSTAVEQFQKTEFDVIQIQMGVSFNEGTPKSMVYSGKSY